MSQEVLPATQELIDRMGENIAKASNKPASERLCYRVEKIAASLEQMTLYERIAVLQMLAQVQQIWVIEHQEAEAAKKAEAEQQMRDAQHKQQLEAEFGPGRGPVPIPPGFKQ